MQLSTNVVKTTLLRPNKHSSEITITLRKGVLCFVVVDVVERSVTTYVFLLEFYVCFM